MKRTKLAMVKDIFFEATNGMRTRSNFVDGQFLMEAIAKHNYKWAIEKWWNEVSEGRNAYWTLNEMVHQTLLNTYGCNATPTATTMEVRKSFQPFKRN
jgi:hypothetical protein